MFTTRSRAVALATLTSLALLAGCGSSSNDNKPDAPTGFTLTPGDGRIYVTWDDLSTSSDLRYWLFSAQTTTMTRDDYRKYPDARITAPVTTGFALTGLTNGLDYAMFMNATHGNGPGGAETDTKTARPRLAGDNWRTPLPADGSSGLNDITAYGLYFYAVSKSGGIYRTDDPGKFKSTTTSWTQITTGTPASPVTTNELRGITAGTSILIAVGAKGTVLWSTDGTTWTNGTAADGKTPLGSDLELNSVTAAPDAYIAVGNNGVILRSTDGKAWTQLTALPSGFPAGTNLNRARSLNGALFIVGDGGLILKASATADTSATADLSKTGTILTSDTTENLHGIAYGGGYFIAVGDHGAMVAHNANDSTDTTFAFHRQDISDLIPDATDRDFRTIAMGTRFLVAGKAGANLLGNYSKASTNTGRFFDWTVPTPNPSEGTTAVPSSEVTSIYASSAGFLLVDLNGNSSGAL